MKEMPTRKETTHRDWNSTVTN